MKLSTTLVPILIATLAMADAIAHASPQEDLAFAVAQSNHDKHSGWIVERLMTFQLPQKCYGKLIEKGSTARNLLASYARSIQRYAAVVTGDDWSAIEGQSANSPEANEKIVDKMVDDFKPKFHITVKLEGDDCEASGHALWMKYIGETLTALRNYPPKSGKMNVVIDVTSKVKGVTAVTGKDGASLTVTASRDIEKSGWPDSIENALQRVSSHK